VEVSPQIVTDKTRPMQEPERFHYCFPMEAVTWEYWGHDKCSSGMATAYGQPRYFRKRSLAIARKIRKRVLDVASGDDALRALLLRDVESLERQLKAVAAKNNNDLEIIADLFAIIAHLLGWEGLDGQFHRVPVYYQTHEQRQDSLRLLAEDHGPSGLFQVYFQRKVALILNKEGLTDERIALVMNLSPSTVRTLRLNAHIDDRYRQVRSSYPRAY
jgi:hypothetical protein